MPDTVVVCSTLNYQSIQGAAAVAYSIKRQRPEIRILPLVTRVDASEKSLFDSMKKHAITRFSGLEGPDITSNRYWFEMEVKYQPRYAYAELLAPFEEHLGVSSSILPTIELLMELGFLFTLARPGIRIQHPR